jgi:mannosylglycoprotein endo-beta-mannosidase
MSTPGKAQYSFYSWKFMKLRRKCGERERSSEKWLLFGDNNSSYFHKIANGRKRKNTMYSLQNDGTLIQGTDSLLTHATSYYKSLFGAGEGNRLSLDPLIWAEGERLPLEDN